MPMPTTVITIDGTPYGRSARATARFNSIDSLTKRLDEGDDEAAFTLSGIGPVPIFACGMAVTISVDAVDVFAGDIDQFSQVPSSHGWMASFVVSGLKTRAARVSVCGEDGTSQAIYNRSPDDPDYVSTDAGLTVGEIIERVLEVSDTATELNALGVGNYTAGALPSATTTDLAALDVTPTTEVAFGGDNLWGQIEAFAKRYHPKYAPYIKPDGTIRFVNLFSLATTRTLTVPGDGTADPVSWPSFSRTTAGCYTRLVIKGRDVQMAEASLLDGSLVRGWDGTQETAWRYSDFVEPKDARDVGAITSLTSTSATCNPDDNTATAASNYWTSSGRAGWIQLYYPAGAGIEIFEQRPITASTSLSAGGTYVISWSQAISHTNYTDYRIVGRSGGLIDVGRLYLLREDSSGDTGRDTYVGSHMVRRFPRPIPWANNGKSFDIVAAAGLVQWSRDGTAPYFEFPVPVEIVPSLGAVRFTEPVFTPTSQPPLVASSPYPADYAVGKPVDVRVAVPYNRGTLSVTVPSSSYEGTAYTELGIERTKTIRLDHWQYKGDTADIENLAQEYLDVMKDEIIEGSIVYHGYPSFDPFALGYNLNIAIQGEIGPLDGIDLPVRSFTLRWPSDGAVPIEVSFKFSNRRRPFEADELYIHPAFQAGGGGQSGMALSMSPIDTSGVIGLSPVAMADSGPQNLTFADLGINMNAGPVAGGGGSSRGGVADPTMIDRDRKGPGIIGSSPPGIANGQFSASPPGIANGQNVKPDMVGPPQLGPRGSSIIDYSTPPGVAYNTRLPEFVGPPSRLSNAPNEDLSSLDLSAAVGNNPTETDDEFLRRFMGSGE